MPRGIPALALACSVPVTSYLSHSQASAGIATVATEPLDDVVLLVRKAVCSTMSILTARFVVQNKSITDARLVFNS